MQIPGPCEAVIPRTLASSSSVQLGEGGSIIPDVYTQLAAALGKRGLAARGGFAPGPDDLVPYAGEGRAATVVLIGNIGADIWPHFAPHAEDGPNALDDWTRWVVEPVATRFGARAIYPFDKPPLPFQRWAMKAEDVAPSPLGILIHPEHGLWHAYRAALIFAEPIALPQRADRPRPCDACAGKPCLSACPVGAFSEADYNVPSCAAYLGSGKAVGCFDSGCLARAACPIGTSYIRDQARFHMRAFYRAVG